jgi:hypothetical protein
MVRPFLSLRVNRPPIWTPGCFLPTIELLLFSPVEAGPRLDADQCLRTSIILSSYQIVNSRPWSGPSWASIYIFGEMAHVSLRLQRAHPGCRHGEGDQVLSQHNMATAVFSPDGHASSRRHMTKQDAIEKCISPPCRRRICLSKRASLIFFSGTRMVKPRSTHAKASTKDE